LTIIELTTGEPAIFFRSVTSPSYKVLPTDSTAARINDFFDEIFFEAILREDGSWLR
jgi:hypothetical protein